MIIRKNERAHIEKARMRDGNGRGLFDSILSGDSLPPNLNMLSEVLLEPRCSIGYHQHTGEYEIMIILEGEAIVTDNGAEYTLRPGDAHLCTDGSFHGTENRTDSTMRMLAIIVRS